MYNALRDAARGVQKSFGVVSEVADNSLCQIFGHSQRDKLARLGSLSVHSPNRRQRQSWTRASSDSCGAPISDAP